MPDAGRVKVEAQGVRYGVKRRCLAFGEIRDFVGAACDFSHGDTKSRAAVPENLGGGFVLVTECVLVICQVNAVVISREAHGFLVTLALLHDDAPEELVPIIRENALVPLLYVNAAAGVLVAVIVNQIDGHRK